MTFFFRSDRERRLWGLTAVLLAAIYASLPFVRTVSDALRDRGQLATTILLILGGCALLVVLAVIRRRPGWRQLSVLVAMGLVYAAFLPRLEQPEERMHLLEYGLVGALSFAALSERYRAGGNVGSSRRARVKAGVLAILFTGCMGWIDEGIQYLLPRRFYDLRDVFFNFLAGALAVGGMLALEAARRRDRPVGVRSSDDQQVP